jgi:hypothetical protein
VAPFKALKSYLIAHWRGDHALSHALWVNMLGLLLLLCLAELYLLPRFNTDPSRMVGNVLLSLLVTRGFVFPWQLLGLLRAIERDFFANREILKTRALQGLAVLTVMFTLIYSLELIQGTVHHRQVLKVFAQPGAPIAYKLTVKGDQLIVHGDLDIGITRAVQRFIQDRLEIRSVVLESRGGHIYEGRGLARIFIDRQYDTYVYDECSSACATAFIGGRKRFIGVQGKLGFHQYKLDHSQTRTGMLRFFDLDEEQRRDQALFRTRGIEPQFLDQMFDQPASQIWFPQLDVLLASKIVHSVVSSQD